MSGVLIAFADTGGGHRAAAQAIRDALVAEEGAPAVIMRDPWSQSAHWPFRMLRHVYPHVVQHVPWLWTAGFRATNRPRVVAWLQRAAWPLLRRGFAALAETTPDLIVCTHPLLTTPLRRTFPDTPIIVVVTDLITGHVSWYDQAADMLIVPTEAARAAALRAGVSTHLVRVVGIPVSPAFTAVPGERAALQAALGWASDRPTVMLAGGAEGIGQIEQLAVAIDRAHLPCDIAVVAGRNYSLAKRLRARHWQGTVHVYDYVTNFAELVRGASVLITKAGPGTIAESCAGGCPLILTSAIADQESGNVDFVTQGRAGVWAPSTLATTVALHAWLVGRDAPAAMRRAASAALKLARPRAAQEVAALVREAVAASVAAPRSASASASRRDAEAA